MMQKWFEDAKFGILFIGLVDSQTKREGMAAYRVNIPNNHNLLSL